MSRKPLYLALAAQMLTTSAVYAGNKVIVKKGETLPKSTEAELIEDYGSFKLYNMTRADALSYAKSHSKASISNDMDMLLFDALTFDTQIPLGKLNLGENSLLGVGSGLQIIQFVGPIKDSWLSQVESSGAQLIHYVANNGYLVWVNDESRSVLNQMAANREVLQFSEPYFEEFKVGHSIKQRMVENADANELVNVTIQLTDSPNLAQSKQIIDGLAVEVESPWNHIMKFNSTRVTVRFGDISQILAMSDSYWVGEYFERTTDDEVQNQILVGDFNGDMSGPGMTGYADFLSGLGFPTTPASYPIVDVTDQGVGNGTVNSGDPTFHEFGDLGNPTRLNHVANCTANATGEAVGSHGHLNTNIVGGFESRVGFPYIDPNGYIRTQGVNPFTRLGSTRIFGPGFDLSACGGTDTGTIQSVQDNGAAIMSNSWGCSGCAGSYDDGSQAYDVGTRDADLTEPGNQEVIMLFAAGNSGPTSASVGTPGNGKNMITVGASENFRPDDEDGAWTDGCGVGPTGADDAMDVIGFSSRGPSPGGRTKPEVIAPGTHIHGTITTGPNGDGSGTCDSFRPSGQTVVGASSGTSHSTPAVAGISSLIYYWMENPPATMLGDFGTPSPAMVKSYLIAHPTYLTGVDGNGDLPTNDQGYGMPNMGLMFDDTLKYASDQFVVFDDTGDEWQWIGSAVDPAKPVRIVMSYTDQAGAVGTSPQVNNLDLSVETGGDTYLGNVFSGQFSATGGAPDAVNNYEAVFFDAGTATDLTITVSALNIAGDGVPNTGDATDQDFAIICYNCGQDPTFTMQSDVDSIEVCAPDVAEYNLDITSILGFTDPVTLSISNVPAGATSGFSVNPVVPTGTSLLTISDTDSATNGSYTMLVDAVAGAESRSLDLELNIFDTIPSSATLTAPVDAATNVPAQPTFTWSADANAASYLLEVATDDLFSNIVLSQVVTDTTYSATSDLATSTDHYWRVTAQSVCGDTVSSVSMFTTTVAPGDCPIGFTQYDIYNYTFDIPSDVIWGHGFENGPGYVGGEANAQGWTVDTAQGPTNWALTATGDAGSSAFQAVDLPEVNDTSLLSPVMSLPSGVGPLTLRFWNTQTIESNAPGCYDSALLEVAVDGGAFTQVTNADIINDDYDGPTSGGFGHPLPSGVDAWCGDPRAATVFNVNADNNNGSDVQYAFRMTSDNSVGRDEGWSIDNVRITGCQAPE
ncbi:MAG: S8 family serine peptidase [Marinicella sp.]